MKNGKQATVVTLLARAVFLSVCLVEAREEHDGKLVPGKSLNRSKQ